MVSSISRAGAAPALALFAVAALAAPPAHAQAREVRFVCQGGGPMVVELTPAPNNAGQVIVAIRAALASQGGDQVSPGACAPADNRFRERAMAAAARSNSPPGVPIQLRMTIRQPLVLNVEVAADQSPRVVLSSQRSDPRAEETLQLYDSAVQGRVFTVVVREAARNPLELTIIGSAARP